MKHLFLEGPIQTGKSTVIRESLKPYMASAPCYTLEETQERYPVGGFASQRLVLAGTTYAFRIGPAMETPLTASLSQFLSLESIEDSFRLHGVFKAFGITEDGKPYRDDSVFENLGVQYLQDTAGRKLMLLDEIGGQEMECEPFMNALYDLLAGDIPCIGVLKLQSNAGSSGSPLSERNEQLRNRIIYEFDGEILYYERGDESVRAIVESFIADALK